MINTTRETRRKKWLTDICIVERTWLRSNACAINHVGELKEICVVLHIYAKCRCYSGRILLRLTPTSRTWILSWWIRRVHPQCPFGFFTISMSDRKSDRISARQKKSGKINLLKSCLQWNLISHQQLSLLWSLTPA